MSGEFDLSMVFRADGSEAVTEGQRVEQAIDGVAGSEARAGAAGNEMAAGTKAAAAAQTELMRGATGAKAATDQAAQSLVRGTSATSNADAAVRKLIGSSNEYERDLAALRAQIDPVGESQRQMARAVDLADTAYHAGDLSLREYNLALQRAAQIGAGHIVNVRAQAAAYQQLSFQLSDVIQGLALGVNPAIVFGQQAGQVAQAFMLIDSAGRGAAGSTAANAAATVAAIAPLEAETAAVGANTAARAAQTAATASETVATEVNTVATGANVVATEAATIATGELAVAKGGLAAFMAGPYGAAIIGVITILGILASKLIGASKETDATADSMEKAASAADSFGNAQSMLGRVIDLTTGKLKTQNSVLIQTIKLLAQVNLLDAQKRLKDLTGKGDTVTLDPAKGAVGIGMMGGQGGDIDAMVRGANQQAAQKRQLEQVLATLGGVVNNTTLAQSNPEEYSRQVSKATDAAIASLDRIAAHGEVAGQKLETVKKNVLDIATAGNDQAAAFESLGVLAGGPIPDSLKPYARDKKPRTKKPKSTEALDEFGRDSADRIRGIVEQFSDIPTAVQRSDKAIRDLDDLIEDLGRKKPPNFEALIASAQKAKVTVQEGLIRTLSEAFEKPKTVADKAVIAITQLDGLIANLGKNQPEGFKALITQANAAKSVILDGLVRPYDEFIQEQQNAVQIQGLISRGRTDEAEALRIVIGLEKQGVPLSQARKDAILASVQAVREEARQTDILREKNQKYVDAIGNIKSAVQDATQAFVRGDLGQFIKSPKKLLDAFMQLQGQRLFEKLFGDLFRDLEDQTNGTKVVKEASDRFAKAAEVAKSSVVDLGNAASSAASKLNDVANPTGKSASTISDKLNAAIPDELHVTANRSSDPQTLFAKSIGGVFEKVIGLFSSDEFAKKVGGTIGKYAGLAIEGAATGKFISGIANSLGIKQNSTGAQIGGAIGNIASSITGIPGLDIVGSILGGTIGNLFTKPKYGTATVTSTYGDTNATGRGAAEISGANTLAGAVQDGVKQIADQLGGILGNFAVSIGTFDGKYRVSTTGFGGSLNFKDAKNQGLVDFGKDGQDAAIAYAILDAIKDGAVQGLSAAVTAALHSSSDIQKALNEALKTQQLELALGGLGATLKKTFDDFDAQAADRLRIAKAYGLDLVAVEKLNADQRAKLVDDTLKARIGSLQDFLNSLKYGDLFEGSAADRRTAILDQIAKVQKDAEAGVAGAADQLASLYQQLTQTSRDAFGTAGAEYTADRTAALTGVERVIQMESDRVNQAAGLQQATTDAINTNNDLTDETNALLAQANAMLANIGATLAGQYGGGGGGVDASVTARYSQLA